MARSELAFIVRKSNVGAGGGVLLSLGSQDGVRQEHRS